jgi:hypothetical protein
MLSFRFIEIDLLTGRELREDDQLVFHCEHRFERIEGELEVWRCFVEFTAYFWEDDPAELHDSEFDDPFMLDTEALGTFKPNNVLKNEKDEWIHVLKTRAPALVYTQMRPLLRLLLQDAGFPQFILPLLDFTSTERAGDEVDV